MLPPQRKQLKLVLLQLFLGEVVDFLIVDELDVRPQVELQPLVVLELVLDVWVIVGAVDLLAVLIDVLLCFLVDRDAEEQALRLKIVLNFLESEVLVVEFLLLDLCVALSERLVGLLLDLHFLRIILGLIALLVVSLIIVRLLLVSAERPVKFLLLLIGVLLICNEECANRGQM